MKRTIMHVAALACLFISGCAVTPEEYADGVAVCASHGGLKFYYVFPLEQIHCNNGIVIRRMGNELELSGKMQKVAK